MLPREGMSPSRFHGLGHAGTWPAFDWADPLLLEASLREEERLVRDSARGFAQVAADALVRDMHRNESFDRGWCGDGKLGCWAAPCRNSAALAGRLWPDCAGNRTGGFRFRSSLSVQSSLVMHPIHAFGSRPARKISSQAGHGEWVGAFGLTEPGSGSDPGAMQSRAQKSRTALSFPAQKAGSPMRRSPMYSWYGPSWKTGFAVLFWSAVTRVCPRPRSKASSRYAPVQPAKSR
jgi:hypothetical protein